MDVRKVLDLDSAEINLCRQLDQTRWWQFTRRDVLRFLLGELAKERYFREQMREQTELLRRQLEEDGAA